MHPTRTCRLIAAFFLLLFAANANAEAIFQVNDNGVGIWEYDQPSTVAQGTVLHLAFVGNGAGTGNFRLFYAAVQGAAEFASAATPRSSVVVTPAVAIDNGTAYTDARHPRIALRTSSELVVVFQAVPAGLAAGDYRLFRARITLSNGSVASQSVSEILTEGAVRMSGTLIDPAFRLVASDGTLRMAYADNTDGNVYFARAGIDNALLVRDPILLSYLTESRGVRPLPRLELDGNNYSHVAWAANDTDSEPTGVYYALVKANAAGTPDTLAIGPTQVLYGNYRWGFPCILVLAPTSVWVFAADQPFGLPGLAGALALTALNPYAVVHDGNPVNVGNLATSALFFLSVPGGTVLDGDFEAYQPEVILDPQLQVHVAGYGYRGGAPYFQGTPGRYYGMGLGSVGSSAATAALASLVYFPVSIGTGEIAYGTQTDGDYTRPAVAHFSGMALHFWSGIDNTVDGARNIYVTRTGDSADPTTQSGCSVVAHPRTGEAGRVPGAAVLFLPALILLARKAARKRFARG